MPLLLSRARRLIATVKRIDDAFVAKKITALVYYPFYIRLYPYILLSLDSHFAIQNIHKRP
jgi:hypothetical protein